VEKIERLFNLIALLLDTPRPLTAVEIRDKMHEAYGQSSDTFHRMFERDKAEIRELGFTIDQDDPIAGDPGYRIVKREALLADPALTADEMAALSLAAQAWGQEGSLGLLKLSIGAGVADPGPSGWVVPKIGEQPDVPRLMDAIARRKVVRFAYRTGGGGEPHQRIVEPHGLYCRGAWYLRGYDRGREAVLSFKLARVDGKINVDTGDDADFERPAASSLEVIRGPWEGETSFSATVAFHPDVAWWVQRRTGGREVQTRNDGWVQIQTPAADLDAFAGWVAGFADKAVVMDPPELREAVVARLRAAAGA
jgi:proteasome accessory factor B